MGGVNSNMNTNKVVVALIDMITKYSQWSTFILMVQNTVRISTSYIRSNIMGVTYFVRICALQHRILQQ